MMDALLVGIDVGCRQHRVAVGTPGGNLIEEFDMDHQPGSLDAFFVRVEQQATKFKLPVTIAMEGHGGWARPLDEMILDKGWKLLNVNNLKLARFKEMFPSPAKTDAIDACKILAKIRTPSILTREKIRTPNKSAFCKIVAYSGPNWTPIQPQFLNL